MSHPAILWAEWWAPHLDCGSDNPPGIGHCAKNEEEDHDPRAVVVDHVDDQLNHVLEVPGIDIVLLDNMGQWQLQHAVKMRNEICGKNKKPLLEASGGITLDNIGVVASTGIDRIAVGAITHSATAVDIALDR